MNKTLTQSGLTAASRGPTSHERKKTNVLMYEGRFIEQRMSEDVKQKIESCFTRYHEMAAIQALDCLIEISHGLSMDISRVSNYPVNPKQFEYIRNIYDSMKKDGRY